MPLSQMESPMILWIKAPGSANAELVGGKSVNISRLVQGGFRVPDAFTVTTDAYSAFLREHDLGSRIGAIVAQLKPDDQARIEAGTTEIRDLIRNAPIPKGMREEIVAAYHKLGSNCRVAVRSSGTAEDLAGASF